MEFIYLNSSETEFKHFWVKNVSLFLYSVSHSSHICCSWYLNTKTENPIYELNLKLKLETDTYILHGSEINELFLLLMCSCLISIYNVLDMKWHQTDGLKNQGYQEKLLSTHHMALLHWMENYMSYHFSRQSLPKLEGYDIIRKEDHCTCKSTTPRRRRGDLSLPGHPFTTLWISILQLYVPSIYEMSIPLQSTTHYCLQI